MATPSLETIPEETSAPTPVPARVTADPPKTKPATAKNPGRRVASGKRLAERNRLAREAKKKAEAEAASGASATTTAGETNTPAQSEANSISLMTMLGIGGLIVSAVVYYQREAIMNSFKSKPQAAPPQAAPPQAPTPAPSRIPVKNGIRKME